MANSLKKRGQKIFRKFSRASIKASEEGKEHLKENLFERISHVRNIRLLILEWGLLILGLIMLAITQAFWFGNSYAENTFVDGGTYIEATLGDVNSLNPLFATTSSEKALSKLMFATLSTVDYSGHINIGLAKTITPSEDGKIWTVELRDNLKWSDGEPITNQDVIFTVELIKNPAVNSSYSTNFTNIKISETEDNKIVFSLPSAYADFISALNFPIVPKHILNNADPKTLVENTFSNNPITSGAFKFNATQSTGNSTIVYLSANPNYYKGAPMLNSFAVHTYSSVDEIINAINSGAVTGTAELSDALSEKVTSKQFYQKNSSLNSGAFIFFNLKNDTLKSRELREAIRQGISLDKIRESASNTIPLNYPLIDSQINITNYPKIPTYDFNKAKEIINKIADKSPIHLNIATVNSGYLPNVTETLKTELENLGIEVSVVVYDENQDFINNVITKRNYDILVYEIELGSDPDLLPYYHSSQASMAGLNLSNYRNALVDDLLLGARNTLDQNLRSKKYESFLEYWVNDIPSIAIYQPNLTYFYNKNVRTYSNNLKLNTTLDRFTDILTWATDKGTKNKTP